MASPLSLRRCVAAASFPPRLVDPPVIPGATAWCGTDTAHARACGTVQAWRLVVAHGGGPRQPRGSKIYATAPAHGRVCWSALPGAAIAAWQCPQKSDRRGNVSFWPYTNIDTVGQPPCAVTTHNTLRGTRIGFGGHPSPNYS